MSQSICSISAVPNLRSLGMRYTDKVHTYVSHLHIECVIDVESDWGGWAVELNIIKGYGFNSHSRKAAGALKAASQKDAFFAALSHGIKMTPFDSTVVICSTLTNPSIDSLKKSDAFLSLVQARTIEWQSGDSVSLNDKANKALLTITELQNA